MVCYDYALQHAAMLWRRGICCQITYGTATDSKGNRYQHTWVTRLDGSLLWCPFNWHNHTSEGTWELSCEID